MKIKQKLIYRTIAIIAVSFIVYGLISATINELNLNL